MTFSKPCELHFGYLAESVLPHVVAVLSSRLLPAFNGSDLFTTTGSSATSHHLGQFLTQVLNSHYQLLTLRLWEDLRGLGDARLPQLLCWLPVDDYVLKHLLQLFMYWASQHFACLPPQPAESGLLTLRSINFLSLPSDPSVGR